MPDTDLEVRVVGIISGERAASSAYRVGRGVQPPAIGHQMDHTMKYDLSELSEDLDKDPELKKWVREASPYAAQTWAGVIPSLLSCQGDCPLNDDTAVITVKVEWGGCGGAHACYRGSHDDDYVMGNGRIIFNPDRYGIYEWTNIRGKDREPTDRGNAIYYWVDNVAVHEFGHAYGLADRYIRQPHYDLNYVGIMKKTPIGFKTISTNDRNALKDIYATHTRGHGW